MSRLLNGFTNPYLNALEVQDSVNEDISRHLMDAGVSKFNEVISELSESLKAQKEGSTPFQRSLLNDQFWDGVQTVLKLQKMMGMDSHHRNEVLKHAQSYFKDFDDGELD